MVCWQIRQFLGSFWVGLLHLQNNVLIRHFPVYTLQEIALFISFHHFCSPLKSTLQWKMHVKIHSQNPKPKSPRAVSVNVGCQLANCFSKVPWYQPSCINSVVIIVIRILEKFQFSEAILNYQNLQRIVTSQIAQMPWHQGVKQWFIINTHAEPRCLRWHFPEIRLHQNGWPK